MSRYGFSLFKSNGTYIAEFVHGEIFVRLVRTIIVDNVSKSLP